MWIENDGFGTLVILADGTARMDYYDGTVVTDDGLEPYTTTWFASYGSAVVEGDILVLDENDQLVLNATDGSMIFTRVPEPEEIPPVEEEAAAELAPIPVGEEGAPFFGLWMLISIQADGMEFDPALLGMTMTLTLTEDGQATVTDDLDTQTTTWHVADGAAMVEGSPLTLNEDGQLVMTDETGTRTRRASSASAKSACPCSSSTPRKTAWAFTCSTAPRPATA